MISLRKSSRDISLVNLSKKSNRTSRIEKLKPTQTLNKMRTKEVLKRKTKTVKKQIAKT